MNSKALAWLFVFGGLPKSDYVGRVIKRVQAGESVHGVYTEVFLSAKPTRKEALDALVSLAVWEKDIDDLILPCPCKKGDLTTVGFANCARSDVCRSLAKVQVGMLDNDQKNGLADALEELCERPCICTDPYDLYRIIQTQISLHGGIYDCVFETTCYLKGEAARASFMLGHDVEVPPCHRSNEAMSKCPDCNHRSDNPGFVCMADSKLEIYSHLYLLENDPSYRLTIYLSPCYIRTWYKAMELNRTALERLAKHKNSLLICNDGALTYTVYEWAKKGIEHAWMRPLLTQAIQNTVFKSNDNPLNREKQTIGATFIYGVHRACQEAKGKGGLHDLVNNPLYEHNLLGPIMELVLTGPKPKFHVAPAKKCSA